MSKASTWDFTFAGRKGPPRANQVSTTPVLRGLIVCAPASVESRNPAMMPFPLASVASAMVGAVGDTPAAKVVAELSANVCPITFSDRLFRASPDPLGRLTVPLT